MALRAFLNGEARSEQSALVFARDQGILETKDDGRCQRERSGINYCSRMYEATRNGELVWRYPRRDFRGFRSIKAGNEFFIHCDTLGRI